jgi:hypothetical protein
MNLGEANRLLTYAAAIDSRHIDDATVIAWHGIVGDLQLSDCLEAVRRHFAGSKDWLMPAHIRELAIKIRDEHRPKHQALSLPSRFEPDDNRTNRVRQGIELCAQTLGMTATRRPRTTEAEGKTPPPPAELIRTRALERARRERKGARA